MIGKREHDAIEVAAQALFGCSEANNRIGWDIVPEEVREYHRECAEDAVVAALKYLGYDVIDFSARIGFDEGVPLTELIYPINDAFATAEIHEDCPVECPHCGEMLAATNCGHCNGSGGYVGLGECEWCGGAKKVHEGCGWMPYSGLVAEHKAMKSAIARVESIAVNLDTSSRGRILEALKGKGWRDVY